MRAGCFDDGRDVCVLHYTIIIVLELIHKTNYSSSTWRFLSTIRTTILFLVRSVLASTSMIYYRRSDPTPGQRG
jgi:hypothetical protein